MYTSSRTYPPILTHSQSHTHTHTHTLTHTHSHTHTHSYTHTCTHPSHLPFKTLICRGGKLFLLGEDLTLVQQLNMPCGSGTSNQVRTRPPQVWLCLDTPIWGAAMQYPPPCDLHVSDLNYELQYKLLMCNSIGLECNMQFFFQKPLFFTTI